MSLISHELRREAAAHLRLATPIIAAQIAFVGFGVADTLMAGHLNAQALAAIGVGANIWMQALVLFMGICMAVSPIVAQRVGAGQGAGEVGDFLRRALLVLALLGLLWIALIRSVAGPVIARLGLDADTAELAHGYLLAESWSAPFFCLCFALRYGAEGMGVTGVILFTGLCGLAVKILLNALLMYGYGGFPALGPVGCGWSTVGAAAVMAAVYAAQFRLLRRLAELELFRRKALRLDWAALEVLRLGLPIGLILFAEAAFFGCTALLMARFGSQAVAAHQLAINVAAVAFMVPLGIGLATTVRVGYAAGAADPAATRLRGQAGMSLGLCFSLFSAALMGLKPEWITALYTRDAALAAQADTFLRYAALFQLFDCLQVTANGALRGIKDTRLPMLITLTAYWLAGMPFAYFMAFGAGFGPNALWWGFIFGLALAAGGLSWRFLHKTGAAFRSVHMP